MTSSPTWLSTAAAAESWASPPGRSTGSSTRGRSPAYRFGRVIRLKQTEVDGVHRAPAASSRARSSTSIPRSVGDTAANATERPSGQLGPVEHHEVAHRGRRRRCAPSSDRRHREASRSARRSRRGRPTQSGAVAQRDEQSRVAPTASSRTMATGCVGATIDRSPTGSRRARRGPHRRHGVERRRRRSPRHGPPGARGAAADVQRRTVLAPATAVSTSGGPCSARSTSTPPGSPPRRPDGSARPAAPARRGWRRRGVLGHPAVARRLVGDDADGSSTGSLAGSS